MSEIILRILFISRLGVACSHLATRLQACSMIDLNKVTCISKLCMFESRTINFTSRKLENYSKNVFSQNEILYAKKIDNFCKITKDQSLSRSWKHIGLGELHHRLQKQPFQPTSIHCQSLLLKVSCSTTLLLKVMLLIMARIWKNMPGNQFKHFYCKVKETSLHVNIAFMFLRVSPDALITCDCHQPASSIRN